MFSGNAIAAVYGNRYAPTLYGRVIFQQVQGGSMVYATIFGLPSYQPAIGEQSPIGPHGFHIHEMGNCENDFQSASGHWNPTNQPHGNHPGDFPVLFSNNGMAHMCFFTNRFNPIDLIGKSIIIHENPDDYRTQPAGNSGRRIGCGVIVPY